MDLLNKTVIITRNRFIVIRKLSEWESHKHEKCFRVRVNRLLGAALREAWIQHPIVGGGRLVHVLGVFHASGRSKLVILDYNVTGTVYLNILSEYLFPWGRHIHVPVGNLLYQDNNAPAHPTRMVCDFTEQESVAVLHQLLPSPDYNPNEHVWNEIQYVVDPQEVKSAEPAGIRPGLTGGVAPIESQHPAWLGRQYVALYGGRRACSWRSPLITRFMAPCWLHKLCYLRP